MGSPSSFRDLIMARCDLFIDGQNFSIACRQLLNNYVDVKGFARMVANKSRMELGTTFFYDSPSSNPAVQRGQQRFWDHLEKTPGVVLMLGRREPNYDGTHREKDCDVMLAVDMVARGYEKKYERAILVGADTDHAYAVTTVQKLGLEVGWAYLPTQRHIDRLKQIIPAAFQLELTEKILRPVRQQAISAWRQW
jgi:uncharacterized LabA/DUF88 family protein